MKRELSFVEYTTKSHRGLIFHDPRREKDLSRPRNQDHVSVGNTNFLFFYMIIIILKGSVSGSGEKTKQKDRKGVEE